VPAICRFDQLGDWFESLASILHWNLRKTQLNLDTDLDLQQDDELKTHVEEEETSEKNQESSHDTTPDPSLQIRL
jgi:hypothetical protein